jgi:N-acetylneuraminic acid mutarotase
MPKWNPGPLSHCSVCVMGKKAYVYGGVKQTGESNSKLFIFDSGQEQWELPKIKGNGPGPMDEHSAVMREDGRMYLFGGYR